MSQTVKARHLKNLKCTECEQSLRLYSKGLICKRNHIFDKQSDEWLAAEAWAEIERKEEEVEVAGFMMRESSGRNSTAVQHK